MQKSFENRCRRHFDGSKGGVSSGGRADVDADGDKHGAGYGLSN